MIRFNKHWVENWKYCKITQLLGTTHKVVTAGLLEKQHLCINMHCWLLIYWSYCLFVCVYVHQLSAHTIRLCLPSMKCWDSSLPWRGSSLKEAGICTPAWCRAWDPQTTNTPLWKRPWRWAVCWPDNLTLMQNFKFVKLNTSKYLQMSAEIFTQSTANYSQHQYILCCHISSI